MPRNDGLTLVAWCPECEWHCPEDEIGKICPGEDCKHIMRKRRGYICEDCEARPIFWTKAALKEHQEYCHATE